MSFDRGGFGAVTTFARFIFGLDMRSASSAASRADRVGTGVNCRGSSVGEEGDDDLETPDLVWVVLAVVEETPPPLVATDDCGAADFLDETFATSDSASRDLPDVPTPELLFSSKLMEAGSRRPGSSSCRKTPFVVFSIALELRRLTGKLAPSIPRSLSGRLENCRRAVSKRDASFSIF